jgi:DNA topoisomerase-1
MPPKFYKNFIKKGEPKEKQIHENAKYLIIVESPSKCEKIESYLGSQYCCISSKGHIRTIEGLKSIDTKNTFEPIFSIIQEKKSHIQWMKTVIEKFSKNNIILASDDDREGEAISWHICQVFDLPVETTQRIIFHEVTKPALLEAISSPKIINMELIKAQHARQVLDILIGYKISPYLWKYLYHSKSNSLSAGRCQTPALRLVYDNEKEKRETETKYKTIGTFFEKCLEYELCYEFENNKDVLHFLNLSKDFEYELSIHAPKESIKQPPRPLHTSRLLQLSSNVLHLSPKETMNLAQELYQSGFITYMRTESSQYSSVFLEKIKGYIIKQHGEKYVGELEEIKNKNNSNPHEAIRVTNIELITIENKNTRLVSLYNLIWRTTIESCMSPAKYNNIKTTITAPLELNYEYTIEIPIFLGWKKIGIKNIEGEQNSTSALLMYLKTLINQKFSYRQIKSMVVVRNKHQHYTEASLVHKLEELGIGRPSTFASLVDTIIERGYVKKTNIEGSLIQCKEYKLLCDNENIKEIVKEKIFGNEKNKLVIQPIGILTVEFLIKTFDKIFSYEYTKNMEIELDNISSGNNKDWAKICKECLKEIKNITKEIKDLTKQSYTIDENYDLIFSILGPTIKHKYIDNGEEKTELLQVKKDINIDLDKLKQGEYKIDELLEIKNNCLGEYEGEPIYIKIGKFGSYVEWGNNRKNIESIKKPINDITLEDIIQFLKSSQNKTENNLLRRLNENLSIRKGKYGPYVFYQRPDMKKPEFLNIKKFNQGFFNCEAETLIEWLKETYNIREL